MKDDFWSEGGIMGSFAYVWCMVWTGLLGEEGRDRRGEVLTFTPPTFFLDI